MARVSFVEKDQAHPRVQESYQTAEDRGQRVLNLWKILAHCPFIGINLQRAGRSILRGEELPTSLRELALIRVGLLSGAEYEVKSHIPYAQEAGVNQKKIDALSDWAASAEFDDQERAVLAYTDEMWRDIVVKDKTFARLKDFFDEHKIVELTIGIGYYTGLCRLLVALQVEREG